MQAPTSEAGQKILEKLAAAGEAGMTRTKLLPPSRSPRRAEAEAAVDALLSRRLIGNLGTEKTPRYVLIEHFRPLEMACAAIESKAVPGRPELFTAAELAKGCKGAVKQAAPEAAALLVSEGKLLKLKRGRSVFYLHTAPLRSLLCPDADDSPDPKPCVSEPGHGVDEEAVRRAYRELARETRLPSVSISRLQERAGVPLDLFKNWLVEQSRQGRAVLNRGDWALAGDVQRKAAVEIHGEPHLLVRLLE